MCNFFFGNNVQVFGFDLLFIFVIGFACYYIGMHWMSMWRGQKIFSLIRDCSSWQKALLIDQHFKFA